MNIFKKLVITLSALLLIALAFDNIAYAGELTSLEIVTDDEQREDTLGLEQLEDADEEENEENIYDPDLYEIYEDEQGQIYYIKRKSLEIEESESQEDVTQENKNAEKKEKSEEKAEKKEKAKKSSYSAKDLRLLSSLVYSEAGNQSYNGMLAVANVVLNRAKSNVYSHVSTIEEVIYDNKWAVQFSVTKSGKGKSTLEKNLEVYDSGKFPGRNPKAEKQAMDRAIKAAKAALEGENNIGDYLCFRLNNKGASSIKKSYSDFKILGDHIFYRTK